MKKFVKFLMTGIALVSNSFAMEADQPLEDDQPSSRLPRRIPSCAHLVAILMASDKVIEGEDGVLKEGGDGIFKEAGDGIPKTEMLKIVVPNISHDKRTVMERRAQFFKEVIFSKGPDCFGLTRAGLSKDAAYVLTYINNTPQSHFVGSLLDHSKTFASKEELVYFLQLLHNKVMHTPTHVATIKAVLKQFDGA